LFNGSYILHIYIIFKAEERNIIAETR